MYVDTFHGVRQRDIDLIQKVVKAQEHKMLKLCQTRWLSRGQVVARIIEQWDALLLYFQTEASTAKVDGASSIYHTMTSAGTKHMLFLNYILPKVDRMNFHFQSEEPRIHTLFDNISSLYKDLLSLFVEEEVLASRDLNAIDPTDKSLHRPLNVSPINFTLFGKTDKRSGRRSGPRSLLGDRDDSTLLW